MQSWEDGQAEKLREHFPGWDVWWVRIIYPKPSSTWHARPKGHPVALVDAESPDELARAILALTR
jgi:hypothetical protein